MAEYDIKWIEGTGPNDWTRFASTVRADDIVQAARYADAVAKDLTGLGEVVLIERRTPVFP